MTRFLWLMAAIACPAQDVNEIVRKSLEREMRYLRMLDDYTYEVKSTKHTYRGDTIKHSETEVEESLHLDGTRYRRMIEKGGRPLPPAEARREQEKLDREMARRRNESPAQRQRRIAEETKRRDEMRQMRQDVGAAFHFRLLGEEPIAGAKCWKIAADPKVGATLRSDMGKRMLPKMRGTFWISQSGYEWLRVEAQVLDTVRFGWVLASLWPGSSFSMEQAQVAPGLWHPRRIEARIKARGLVIPFNTGADVEFRNFRKFSTETRMLSEAEARGDQGTGGKAASTVVPMKAKKEDGSK